MSENLKSSKFRYLNEQLYKNRSGYAAEMFKESPHLFDDVSKIVILLIFNFENQYHEGYRYQVTRWPKNPLDMLIAELKKPKYLNDVVADFGCGEGKLELELKEAGHQGNIYSFDVGKCADHVIQTDISSVPLEEESVDVGVFSLSLMGTNFPDFLVEANRVLKPRGKLFVAEVLSRFKDVNAFVKHCGKEAGLKAIKVTKLKDFFYLMIFEKREDAQFLSRTEAFSDQLKACLYKKR